MPTDLVKLQTKLTPGAEISTPEEGTLQLRIPSGPAGRYRLAQLDDYSHLPRKNFPWRPGSSFHVQMRASTNQIPGTWGIGFWNNPFGMAILTRVEMLRLPALPESAWFFFASSHNYLSFRDDLPAHGALAATFRVRARAKPWLALAVPLLPLYAIPAVARSLRKLIRKTILEDSYKLPIDPTDWHDYHLDWQKEKAVFQIDGQSLFVTEIVPDQSLGFVLWIDNQYAAFRPDGQLRFGTLENPAAAWIEIRQLTMNGQKPVLTKGTPL